MAQRLRRIVIPGLGPASPSLPVGATFPLLRVRGHQAYVWILFDDTAAMAPRSVQLVRARSNQLATGTDDFTGWTFNCSCSDGPFDYFFFSQ